MTIQEQILFVDSLLTTILYPYRENGQTKIYPEQRELIKQLYEQIFGSYNIDLNCNTCVIHYLCMFETWKSSINIPQQEPIQQSTSEQIADQSAKKKKGGCSSCKNKK